MKGGAATFIVSVVLALHQPQEANAAAAVAAAFAPSFFGASRISRCSSSRAPPPALTRRHSPTPRSTPLPATTTTTDDTGLDGAILTRITDATPSSTAWGEAFDLPGPEAAFHSLFSAIKSSAALGLKGKPFHLKQDDVLRAMSVVEESEGSSPFAGFFTFDDLAKAVAEDFLDADRGSTNNAKGWKVTSVSTPRGSSFEDARMTVEEVNAALEKGTVIFNAIGAHIPKLAGPTLACCDATSLPNAVNMYVTAPGKRTSAPPHTDRQDVVVVQTQGRKHWRVYTPANPALDASADMYARGKGDDGLPLHALETTFGCRKLLDVTLETGDVLFVPAGFPHTTDTAEETPGAEQAKKDTSIHLTFNLDTHVWDLDYLSVRRLALKRAGVSDTALGQNREDDNRYVGEANLLPAEVRDDLFESLPLELLDDDDDAAVAIIDEVAAELERISRAVDEETASAVDPSVWREAVEAVRRQGMQILDIHRDMYLAAIEEGRTRKSEADMTAHLTGEALARATAMTPEKMQRLSLFRVRDYFAKITESKKELSDWSMAGAAQAGGGGAAAGGGAASALPPNWEFTVPLNVGDKVEADLGGALFPATVTKKVGGGYDVEFFDGDRMGGLDRSMIKLLNPPSSDGGGDDIDTTGLTPKEIKRLRKKQEKKKKKGGR